MGSYTVSQWVLFFDIYCFIGWVWESCYVSVTKGHWVNRGFMKGPFLPIYGFGALTVLVVTIPFKDNIPLMCLAGMLSSAVLEYVTGAVMERLFHVRYWDYSNKFLNLHGYICLESVLCWGVLTFLLVDVIQVQLEKLVLLIDPMITEGIVLLLFPVIVVDFVTSFYAAIHLKMTLIQKKNIKEELHNLVEKRKKLEAEHTEANAKKRELELSISSVRGQFNDKIRAQIQELTNRTAVAQDLKSRIDALQERKKQIEDDSSRMHPNRVRSIHGLLKRNPGAVSYTHKDEFPELKEFIEERIKERQEAKKKKSGHMEIK